MDAPSPSPSDDAARWLAAAAARLDDDAALLDALSDDEVAALLAAEGGSPAGVAAAVRRRVREAERAATSRRWRWPATVGALAVAAVLAVFALRPATPAPADQVLAYRGQLTALAAPPTKGTTPTPLAAGARDLLAAADATPPDTALARRAARALARADDATGAAVFFEGLAHALAGDGTAADAAFRRVPADSPYADAARDLR